jgi:hypothetical protein
MDGAYTGSDGSKHTAAERMTLAMKVVVVKSPRMLVPIIRRLFHIPKD